MLTLNELVLTFGGLLLCYLVIIDQEMWPWECRQTDGHTHWRRQTECKLIICPMLYAIAMVR